MWKSCMNPPTHNKKWKRKKKISGSVHIKKHKQILCSFITKYSATINIAFLSPFHLRPENIYFASPDFFLFLTLVVNTRRNPCSVTVLCHKVKSSFLQQIRLQIQRRKHNTDPAQNKTKKNNKKKQEEHKE